MLIETLPPRLMCRVMAIRAASICRFVTYAGSSAIRPYSPKVTRVPPVAAPERPGWCCLRCLTRLGMSIASGLRSGRVERRGPGGRDRLGWGTLDGCGLDGLYGTGRGDCTRGAPRGARGRTGRTGRATARELDVALSLAADDVALVDPDLDADPAERCPRLVHAVVDVGPQSVQRHAPLEVELRAAHL